MEPWAAGHFVPYYASSLGGTDTYQEQPGPLATFAQDEAGAAVRSKIDCSMHAVLRRGTKVVAGSATDHGVQQTTARSQTCVP